LNSDLTTVPEKSGLTIKRVILGMTLFFCFSIITAGGWLYRYTLTTIPMDAESVVVTIPRGSSVIEIGHILAEAGLIPEDMRFQILAKLMGVSSRLQAGEFRLPTGHTPMEILKELSIAKPVEHKITVVEGMTAKEIGRLFADSGWGTFEEFMQLIEDPAIIKKYGFEGNSLEGYLFPDTYHFTKASADAESLVDMMVSRFKKVWAELADELAESEVKLTPQEIVILASIVEKETGASEERPRIASVFINRLRVKMPLQSDPTVIYGIKNFSGNITRKDLKTPSPYNTYTLPALPVGPICSPGKAALEAVISPASEKFLYFVSKNNGTHQFSRSLKEHNRAVQKYQRNRKKR
jgi:UPF0755 protein